MNFSLIQIASAFMVLFAIIDILGSIPIIMNIKKKLKNMKKQNLTKKEIMR